MRTWKARWLRLRISLLEGNIAVASARRADARITLESVDRYIPETQERVRALRARLSLLEPARKMLDDALHSRSTR